MLTLPRKDGSVRTRRKGDLAPPEVTSGWGKYAHRTLPLPHTATVFGASILKSPLPQSEANKGYARRPQFLAGLSAILVGSRVLVTAPTDHCVAGLCHAACAEVRVLHPSTRCNGTVHASTPAACG